MLRCGSGLTSRAVLVADNGGNYSHVGIVVDSSGVMMIVHAVPGEHDFPNDFDRVKMDEAKTFFLTTRTKNGRIMRYSESIVAQKAAQLIAIVKDVPADAEIAFTNVSDGTIEGLEYKSLNAFSIQFTPDCFSATVDTDKIYDKFISLMGGDK